MIVAAIKDPLVSNQDNNSPEQQIQTFTVYWKRWLILIMFCIYAISSIIHWMQYSAIADVVVKYYSVSFQAVDGSATIFSLLYIIFCIPGSYILDRLGLRISLLIGIVGNCIGSWLKVIAVNPNRFWLVLVSQCVIAIFQVLVLPIPPKLAAVWFGANEVSFACTLGIIAMQLSFGLGMVIPPLVVEQGDIETIQTGFNHLAYGIAIFTTIYALLLFLFFDDAPPTIPSAAQMLVQNNKQESFDYKKSLKSLLKNKSFVLLLLLYGIHEGASVTIPVILNQIILAHYPDAYKDVGMLGLSMSFCGIIGSLIYGIMLSKFGRLKLITWFAFIGCTTATFLFFFLLDQGLVMVYILGITMSLFWCITFCVGFEVGAEITYPEPEAAFGGLLINFYQLFSIIVTYFYAFVHTEFGEFIGNMSLVTALLLADVLLFFIKFDLKRSKVDSKSPNVYTKLIT